MEEKGKGRQVREEGKGERREAEATSPEGLRERRGREREHRQAGTAQDREEARDPLDSAVEGGGDWEWVGLVS